MRYYSELHIEIKISFIRSYFQTVRGEYHFQWGLK